MLIGQEYKIIVTGAMGAGKTTAIAAISDVAPVTTEAVNSDQTINLFSSVARIQNAKNVDCMRVAS